MTHPSRIRDNKYYGTVADFLKEKIEGGSSLSVVSAYFTINAFNGLKPSLTGLKALRLLFGEPSFIAGIDAEKQESKAFQLTEAGISLRDSLSQKGIAKACAEWIREKVEIRSVRRANFLHGKMYYIEKGDKNDALIGSSNFTARGLGLIENASNIELNLEVDSKNDCQALKAWFDNLWESDEVKDVKAEVLRHLANAYTDKAPEFIYFKTLYHVFERFLSDRMTGEKTAAQTRLRDTQIWEKLYPFQRDGVLACLQKIRDYNGCIIADSVGLGKTYEALAIIKYFELQEARVLVLCPKKLEQNWTLYPRQFNNRHNPFRNDGFHYHVLAHTDLSRDRGMSGQMDLATFEWDAYDFVVIDESHHFRNRPAGKPDRKSRYHKLMKDIIQSGGNTRVLMLSATPVNNSLLELQNQICLITADKDDAFSAIDIPSLRGTLRNAQSQFEAWTSSRGEDETHVYRTRRTAEPAGVKPTGELLQTLGADFLKLLDALTIARSRRHIENFYSDSMAQIGGFPERAKPQSIYPDIDSHGKFPSYAVISNQIDGYKLSLFNPSGYIRPECLHHYTDGRIQQREFNLIGMMKVNFLKRLESSVYSFRETLARTLEKIAGIETAILARLQGEETENPGDVSALSEFGEAETENDEELDAFIQAGKNQIYRYEHLDLRRWLQELHDDKNALSEVHKAAVQITADRDAKLAELKRLIEAKVQNPTTNREGKRNRKVLVFTAFADTANYLYDKLHVWATEKLAIQCAVVTGSDTKTTCGRNDFNDILTNFSPISRERAETQESEIELLIATDCISEGQNLQDCDYLVNYDIHWNPVRIIQRFGRIDRIGSLNEKVQLVNFWPTAELDDYINLKSRVEARMVLVNLTGTGDDNLLETQNLRIAEGELTHREEQLKRMQTEILDIDDVKQNLNLNQFTLDDFRAQLLNYLRKYEEKLRDAPLGLYAVTAPSAHDGKPVAIEQGVIFCLRQTDAAKENEKLNPIHPYYLVHVTKTGEVSIGFANPKQILEFFSALCIGKTEPEQELCHWFNDKTYNGEDMVHYDELIQTCVNAIKGEYNRHVNDRLEHNVDFLLPIADIQIEETTQFELITWLIITREDSPFL